MKKMSRKALALVLALVAVLGISVTAYAAVNNQSVSKVGKQYVVDTVTAEATVDGVLVQTIERKYIPEDRYDPNNPRTPKPTTTNKTQQLRQAGIDSRNDLQTYAWSYQWSTTTVEASASDSKLVTNITFQVDESASVDRWKATFKQVVTFDKNGNPVVKYHIGDQAYSVDAIKRMFAKYGTKR